MGSDIIHQLYNAIEHLMVSERIMFYNGICVYRVHIGDALSIDFEPNNRPVHYRSYGIFHFKPCEFNIMFIIDCSHQKKYTFSFYG